MLLTWICPSSHSKGNWMMTVPETFQKSLEVNLFLTEFEENRLGRLEICKSCKIGGASCHDSSNGSYGYIKMTHFMWVIFKIQIVKLWIMRRLRFLESLVLSPGCIFRTIATVIPIYSLKDIDNVIPPGYFRTFFSLFNLLCPMVCLNEQERFGIVLFTSTNHGATKLLSPKVKARKIEIKWERVAQYDQVVPTEA